jgi:hypothetical protein
MVQTFYLISAIAARATQSGSTPGTIVAAVWEQPSADEWPENRI